MRQRQQTRQDATYRSRKSVQTTGAGSQAAGVADIPRRFPTLDRGEDRRHDEINLDGVERIEI
jgi:hypothetical protein